MNQVLVRPGSAGVWECRRRPYSGCHGTTQTVRPDKMRVHWTENDIEHIRELIAKPYRIIYRIKPDQIDVLAVIHGAMLFPDDF